jgi:YidC/Oxa1 family membrane protein insertase
MDLWTTIIVQPMTNILLWIYAAVGGNFGLAIILFTALIRLVTHPLMVQQIKGTTAMQNLQSNEKWIAMQKKYKDDKEKLAQEQMKLYKELGINPFGSCLPTLIQLPIIFGIYQAVIRALAITPFQLAGFYKLVYDVSFINTANLIPLNSKFLWIQNLSQPESLSLFGINIPVLTILVVITTFLQSKLMQVPSANPNDANAQTAKMMNIYMPLLMGYIAYTLAAGLAVYFVASNLISVLQYAALGKLNWRNILPGSKPEPAVVKAPKHKQG